MPNWCHAGWPVTKMLARPLLMSIACAMIETPESVHSVRGRGAVSYDHAPLTSVATIRPLGVAVNDIFGFFRWILGEYGNRLTGQGVRGERFLELRLSCHAG